MIIKSNKITFYLIFSALLISVIFLISCTKDFSVSNPAIQKLAEKAQQLMKEEKFLEAVGRLESINDLNPNLPKNHYNLGIAYYKNNEYKKAVDSLKKAVKLDKNLKDAYYSIAVIYEDNAVQKIEELEKIDKTKKDKEKFAEIIEEYKNAKDFYISYLKFFDNSEENEAILEKIKEINKEIKEFEKQLESNSNKN